MNEELKKLRKQSKTMDAAIIIGKNGLTDTTIENIKKVLKKDRIVKIKILKTHIDSVVSDGKDKYFVFQDIASRCDATIVHTLGFTITLKK